MRFGTGGRGTRSSVVTQFVLEAVLTDPGKERSVRELSRSAGVRTGAVRPVLARLEAVGWLQSRWEDADPVEEGRPAGRRYRLTVLGAAAARGALAASGRPVAAPRPWRAPAMGES